MGACDVTVNAFMPDRSPVPFFQRQFAASLEHAGPPVFVADFIVRRSGFLLVGTGQSVPVTPAPSRRPSAKPSRSSPMARSI